jgi:hypothetical protein
MARTHPLRTATPDDLARWLDAFTLEGGRDYGLPGFPELRAGWTGQLPADEVIPLIEPWTTQQVELQTRAQQLYLALDAVEPVRSDAGIAAWFPTRWAEILLSLPWDERLAAAIADGVAYLDAR